MSSYLHSHTFPLAWKVNVKDYESVSKYLDRLTAEGVGFHNHARRVGPPNGCLNAIISRIRELLTDEDGGVALLDLGHTLKGKPELIDRAKLLIVAMGESFGQTVTRNHLSNSVFFPVYQRKEGKGPHYVGNALSNNRPGLHTDGSAWRLARIDVLALLSIQQALIGGDTIIVNAPRVFQALPAKVQNFLCERRFIRQDPFDPDHPDPVRRSVYCQVEGGFYSGLAIRYHRSRINGGHQVKNEPLTREDVCMLDTFERLLNHRSFRLRFRLQSGHILLLNNNIICHDRTAFRDLGSKRRYLERYWAGEVYQYSTD